MAALPAALYEPEGGVLVPTALTRGPWNPLHQHAGPPSALLARAVEAAAGIAGAQTARVAIDILAPVPLEPLRVQARVVRPGRRVELLEASLALASGGAELMRARAWRMRTGAVELPGDLADPDPPPPGPDGLGVPTRPAFWVDDVAYFHALDWRFVAGRFDRPGPAAAWGRVRVPLVAGEEIAPLERLLVMGDAASGISAALDWTRWTFANVDFDLALQRPPEGEWTAMDARTRFGDAGAGVCTAVLYDTRGRVGVSTQSLFVARRP